MIVNLQQKPEKGSVNQSNSIPILAKLCIFTGGGSSQGQLSILFVADDIKNIYDQHAHTFLFKSKSIWCHWTG